MAFSDFLSSLGGGGGGGGGIMDAIMPLLVTGGSALASHLLGAPINKAINQANNAQSQIVGATVPGAANMLKSAEAGNLTPSQQAAYDQAQRRAQAQVDQQFASMGIPVSTMKGQADAGVTEDMLALKNKLLGDTIAQAQGLLGVGNTAAQAQLNSAMQQKQDLAKTIGDVAQQIGIVLGTNNAPAAQTPAIANVPTAWTNPYDTGYGSDPYANLFPVNQT